MKLLNLFLDELCYTRLFKQTREIYNIRRLCYKNYYKLSETILKIILMPSSRYIEEWNDKILQIKYKLSSIQTSYKLPSFNNYYSWLIEIPEVQESDITEMIAYFIDDYKDEEFSYPELKDKNNLWEEAYTKPVFVLNLLSEYREKMKQFCINISDYSKV